MSNQGKSGFLLGGAIGAGLGYLLALKFAGNEERPPIIVRGGSLHFENTTGKRPGKKWKKADPKDDKKWELDDGNGKKVSFFQVYFVPSTASSCLPVEGETVEVQFASTGGVADRTYVITIEDDRPVVIGTHALERDPYDATRLIAATSGRITAVKVDSTMVCSSPTDIFLEPMKKRP